MILTKTDKLVTDLQAGTCGNAEKVFTDEGVKGVVEKVSSLLGLQKNAIFPVKNYESEIDLDVDVDILALMALRQMLFLSEDCVDNLLMGVKSETVGEVKGRVASSKFRKNCDALVETAGSESAKKDNHNTRDVPLISSYYKETFTPKIL